MSWHDDKRGGVGGQQTTKYPTSQPNHSGCDGELASPGEQVSSCLGRPVGDTDESAGPFQALPQMQHCRACGRRALHIRSIPRSILAVTLGISILGCFGPAFVVGILVDSWVGALTAIGLMGVTKKYLLPRVAARFPWICSQCGSAQDDNSSNLNSAAEAMTAA